MAWELVARLDCDQDWDQWAWDGQEFHPGQGPMKEGSGYLCERNWELSVCKQGLPDSRRVTGLRMVFTIRPGGPFSPAGPPLLCNRYWADIPPCYDSLQAFSEGDKVELEVSARGVRSRLFNAGSWREFAFVPGDWYMPFTIDLPEVRQAHRALQGEAEVYIPAGGDSHWQKFWTRFVNSIERQQ